MCVHTHEGTLVKTCKLCPHPLYTAVPPFNSSGPGMFYKGAEVTWASACRVLGPGSVVGVAVMAARAPCPVWCGRRAAEREPLTTGFRALAPAYLVLGWFHGGQLVSLVIQS